MVATGAADRLAERIREIIYLDAFVPADGQSILDFHPPEQVARLREIVEVHGAGWLMPPSPLAPDLPPGTVEWLKARRMPQPLRTFEEPIRLTGAAANLPRAYIYCTQKPPDDVFAPIAARFRREAGWRYRRDRFRVTRRTPARRIGSPISSTS